jgi:hypothetical protein
MKYPRKVRMMRSKTATPATATASSHIVSMAKFGTTRSYTVLIKSGIARAKRFDRTVPNKANP